VRVPSSFTVPSSNASISRSSLIGTYATSSSVEKPSWIRMSATSSSTSSLSMKWLLMRPLSSCCFLFDSSSVIRLICQPVSSEARRTFWPLRPIATARFSSSTTTSMACFSSSTTIDDTSAGALALEQPFLDLRHLELEQLHDELRRGARQDELRAARLAVDLHHPGAHPVADPEVLLRDHVLARQQRLEAAGLDDGAAALHALH